MKKSRANMNKSIDTLDEVIAKSKEIFGNGGNTNELLGSQD